MVALIGATLTWWLAQFWWKQPESADRFLILIASGWLLLRIRDEIRTLREAPASWGLVLIAPAIALLPAAWYLYMQVGPMPILVWCLGIVFVSSAFGLIVVQFGSAYLRRIAFPLLFMLFAMPPPTGLLFSLQTNLQTVTTASAEWLLPAVGIPVQRRGFVLSIPSGNLGVSEACSGIRGVTAVFAVAAFIAYYRRLGLVRGLILVLCALVIIVASNIVRVVVSALLQEQFGVWTTQGAFHDGIGVVTLLLGLIAVWTISQLLLRQRCEVGLGRQAEINVSRGQPRGTLEKCQPKRVRWAEYVAAMMLSVAVGSSALAAWSVKQSFSGAEQTAPIQEISMKLGPWVGKDLPMAPDVLSILACDSAVHRSYRNPTGQQIRCWISHWTVTSAARDLVHHPDICWPNQGWTLVRRERVRVSIPQPAQLEMTLMHFEQESLRQVVGYWAQDGAHPWSVDDEERVRTNWPTRRWVMDRLLNHKVTKPAPRLVVLIGADVWDGNGLTQQAVEEFASELASELYRVCPWALPIAEN